MEQMSSLSKKWRIAVKNNLFNGSFAEFAEMYNSDFGESDYYPDNAQDTMGIKRVVQDSTTIKPTDLKPIDTKKAEQLKVFGMEKNTFILFAGGLLIGTSVGLYFLLKKLGQKGES